MSKSRSNKGLTPKQLHFARCVASGMNQSDAYRESYNSTGKHTTVNVEASKLMSNPNVRQRVDQLIAQRERAMINSSISDKEKVLTALRTFMDSAEPSDSMRIRATELLGKTAGLFKDVTEQTIRTESSDELREKLQEKLSTLRLVSNNPSDV